MKTNTTEIPSIIRRAMTETVVSIGQLKREEIKQLNVYVRSGILVKGKGGSYPSLKTVYAIKGHDFIQNRRDVIENAMRIAKYENRQIL